MSVIVTGMSMPKNCARCEFRKYHDGDDFCELIKILCGIEWRTKDVDCPLKPVEGLIEEIEQRQRIISLFKGLSGAEEMKGMNDCIKIIKEYCGLEESNGES